MERGRSPVRVQRYVDGQRIYYEECRPDEHATIVIDYNDFSNPVLRRAEQ
jgi:uridine kinase